MSDLARAIAFAYQRKGARTMPRLDLHMVLSMDLRWFAPEESKKVVARALDAGLLVAEGDSLRATFDPAAVHVPLTFRPQAKALLEEEIAALPQPQPQPKPQPAEHEAELERAKRGGMLSLDVARLVVARRAGEDVRGRLAEAEAAILKH
jgi:hypothetical protein